MDIKYINPFIESVLGNLETLASIGADKMEISISKDAKTGLDISAVIGLSGEVRGSAIISLPEDIALKIASAMFMEELGELNDDVKDAIGEFANIVIGNARNKLVDAGLSVNISTPTIIVGKGHEISHPHSIPFLVIPFKTDINTFEINIGIKENK